MYMYVMVSVHLQYELSTVCMYSIYSPMYIRTLCSLDLGYPEIQVI